MKGRIFLEQLFTSSKKGKLEAMKLLHTADWHIGKKLFGYDLYAEQQDALQQILKLAKQEAVDAIIIAGDVYDRQLPDQQSVALVNRTFQEWNLTEKIPLLVVSGNHDSAIRLATGNPWYQQTQFHLHTTIEQAIQPVDFPEVQFYLLPYIEPYQIKQFFYENDPDHPLAKEVVSLDSGLQAIIDLMKASFNPEKKQILVSHFFVAGSLRQESETPLEVGGLASVSKEVFADFAYVALGHLHSPKACNHGNIRYSGSPLKYAVSECADTKGVYLIDTDYIGLNDFKQVQADFELHELALRFIPLKPLHEIRTVTTDFQSLLNPDDYLRKMSEDYLAITLTDHEPILNIMAQLRSQYPRILSVTRSLLDVPNTTAPFSYQDLQKELTPNELVQTFFEQLNQQGLSTDQSKWLTQGLQAIQSSEKRGD